MAQNKDMVFGLNKQNNVMTNQQKTKNKQKLIISLEILM